MIIIFLCLIHTHCVLLDDIIYNTNLLMSSNKNNENLTEDKTEKIIRKFYEKKRWTVEEEARGNEHGPDLVFRKKSKKMIIEVKGMPTPKHGGTLKKTVGLVVRFMKYAREWKIEQITQKMNF